jgi:hypothetical protein
MINIGIGNSTKSRTRIARSSDQRRPVHAARSTRSASRRFFSEARSQSSSRSCSPKGYISVRGACDRDTRVAVTGLTAVSRSRTAQAKKDDSEFLVRRTDASAKPCRLHPTSARVISGSVTAAICMAPRDGGMSRIRAASATYVFGDTACLRSSSQVGSSERMLARPARGSTPSASAAFSRA